MAKIARDLMQTHIITVSPHDPLHVVQRLFVEEGIHGAPVVDELGRLQGIITSTDILRAATEEHDVEPVSPAIFDNDLDVSRGGWALAPEDLVERLRDVRVSDYMTERVVQVPPDAPVPDVARAMRENLVHRLLVVDGDRLLGIVSAFDLIALLEPSSAQ